MADEAVYIDMRRLADDLSKATGKPFEDAAREVVADAAYQVQLLASQYAPRKTGALANSIVVEISGNGLTAEVYPTKSYALFMEYGTGSRGEYGGQPYTIHAKPGKTLRFVVHGKVLYRNSVTTKGIAPRPFMRPAGERAVTALASNLGNNAVKMIVNTPANGSRYPTR